MTVQLNSSGTFPSMIPLARTFLTKRQRLVHKDETWALVSGLPRDYHTVVRVQHLSLGRLVTVGQLSNAAGEFRTRGGISGRHLSILIFDMTCRRFWQWSLQLSTTVTCNWWCLFLNVSSWRSSLALFDCSWFIFFLFIFIPIPKLIILCQ